MTLSPRFEEALVLATRLHADQYRKGSDVPYICHPLAVASLVLGAGGDEDEAIAALLHDAIEDQGEQIDLDQIRQRFGGKVVAIVNGCTDAHTRPKPPWRGRKEAYIAHLQHAPAPERLVAISDKLHNARTLLYDYAEVGEKVWERFTGGREGTLWYYRSLVEAFQSTGPTPYLNEFQRVVSEIERLAAENEPV
jgi:(p)ppGpp synthase/HD superfamily hydrolase